VIPVRVPKLGNAAFVVLSDDGTKQMAACTPMIETS
jgi:hypothetical protein